MTLPQPQGTAAIETHGCKLNTADSQALAARFVQAGYEVVEADQPADIYVLNTCTVTHVADRKARQALRAAHRRNPQTLIVATGCYAQRAPAELAQVAGVTVVIGNREKDELVDHLLRLRDQKPVPCATGVEAPWSGSALFRTRAMLKIQEGCNQVCAYCIVPKVRGRERSVPLATLVAQVQERVAQGYAEVVLTGTQLGSYGLDLPGVTLTKLLHQLLEETKVRRLRVSSLQPQEVTPELLDLWQDSRLCPHFHMPLQSGSDTVLRRMRRRYTREEYAEVATRICERLPHAAITTDVLVGFPGETDQEFAETYALCRSTPFARMHVFPYSVRPGTSAAHFKEQVDDRVKAQRVQQLLELAQQHQTAFQERFAGTVRPVLWEETGRYQEKPVWKGLSDNYLRVLVQADTPLGGTITPVRLGRPASKDTLWGEPL